MFRTSYMVWLSIGLLLAIIAGGCKKSNAVPSTPSVATHSKTPSSTPATNAAAPSAPAAPTVIPTPPPTTPAANASTPGAATEQPYGGNLTQAQINEINKLNMEGKVDEAKAKLREYQGKPAPAAVPSLH